MVIVWVKSYKRSTISDPSKKLGAEGEDGGDRGHQMEKCFTKLAIQGRVDLSYCLPFVLLLEGKIFSGFFLLHLFKNFRFLYKHY